MDAAENNPNIIGQRLQAEMKKRGINSVKLAAEAGVKTSFLYDIISGKSANPSTVKLARVADSLGISLNALVETGNPNFKSPANDDRQSELVLPALDMTAFNGSTPSFDYSQSRTLDAKILNKENKSQNQNMCWALMSGDHMAPTLLQDDLLVIDTSQNTPNPPGLYYVVEKTGNAIKRLQYTQENHKPAIRVSCDNPSYSAYELDVEDCVILGKLVWFSRNL